MKQLLEKTAANCPSSITLNAIGGRWKVHLIYRLLSGTQRYSELQRYVPDATAKMLTQQLRELERDGLLIRVVYAQVPPKVEYSLTVKGASLEPVIRAMEQWGAASQDSNG